MRRWRAVYFSATLKLDNASVTQNLETLSDSNFTSNGV